MPAVDLLKYQDSWDLWEDCCIFSSRSRLWFSDKSRPQTLRWQEAIAQHAKRDRCFCLCWFFWAFWTLPTAKLPWESRIWRCKNCAPQGWATLCTSYAENVATTSRSRIAARTNQELILDRASSRSAVTTSAAWTSSSDTANPRRKTRDTTLSEWMLVCFLCSFLFYALFFN